MFCVQCDQNNAQRFARVKGNISQLYTALTGLIIHDEVQYCTIHKFLTRMPSAYRNKTNALSMQHVAST